LAARLGDLLCGFSLGRYILVADTTLGRYIFVADTTLVVVVVVVKVGAAVVIVVVVVAAVVVVVVVVESRHNCCARQRNGTSRFRRYRHLFAIRAMRGGSARRNRGARVHFADAAVDVDLGQPTPPGVQFREIAGRRRRVEHHVAIRGTHRFER
jgi:hypothetical protein